MIEGSARRVSESWWAEALHVLSVPIPTALDSMQQLEASDERDLAAIAEEYAQNTDIPTSKAGIKKHPLYVMEDQLGKTQCIIPGNSPPT